MKSGLGRVCAKVDPQPSAVGGDSESGAGPTTLAAAQFPPGLALL